MLAHCTGCTETKTETIPATGHKWDNGTVTTAPTCTAKGVKTFECTNSDCTATKTEEVAATGHKWDSGKITTEPTCTKDGVKTFKCTNSGCAETKTEAVAKLGHSFGKTEVIQSPDLHEPGVRGAYCEHEGCTEVGNKSTIPATGHKWDNGTMTTAPTCTAKGVKTAHQFRLHRDEDRRDRRDGSARDMVRSRPS